MTDTAKEILEGLSKSPHAKSGAELRFSSDIEEKSLQLHAVEELVHLGYVMKTGAALGFAILVITPAGEAALAQT